MIEKAEAVNGISRIIHLVFVKMFASLLRSLFKQGKSCYTANNLISLTHSYNSRDMAC
jgi:hypothetical protein